MQGPPVHAESSGRARRRRGRVIGRSALCAAVLLVSLGPSTTAHAASNACTSVDEQEIGRILGPTRTPETTTLDGEPACDVAVPPDLRLVIAESRDGADAFSRRRSAFADGSVEQIDDYANAAFFGWGRGGALEFVARRGDQTVTMRLTGSDANLDFDGADPVASAPGRAPSGSTAGSGLWVLMTDYLKRTGSKSEQPPSADLTGLWRTADITPCAPRGIFRSG